MGQEVMFLTIMVVGLVGLLVMALPALGHHGAAHQLGGHGPGAHVGQLAHGHAPQLSAPATRALTTQTHGTNALTLAPTGITRFLPSPRLVFSLLALYGAFANALWHAAHLTPLVAALVAVLPAALVERLLVTPLWRLLFRFQGQPSTPLEVLILAEASAVTPFRNGRGIVSLVRDGRAVQFSASLVEAQAGLTVRVGDRLRVEDVDARNERLTVSVLVD